MSGTTLAIVLWLFVINLGIAFGESAALASRWWTLNCLRHAIVLAAWLAALKTFALFQRASST